MKSKAQNEFTGRLLKNDPDALYEMRVCVEGLLEHPGWQFVMDLVDSRVAETRLLMETGLHHQAEYTGFIGEIRGMQVAKAAVDAVLDAAAIQEKETQLVAQLATGDEDHG